LDLVLLYFRLYPPVGWAIVVAPVLAIYFAFFNAIIGLVGSIIGIIIGKKEEDRKILINSNIYDLTKGFRGVSDF